MLQPPRRGQIGADVEARVRQLDAGMRDGREDRSRIGQFFRLFEALIDDYQAVLNRRRMAQITVDETAQSPFPFRLAREVNHRDTLSGRERAHFKAAPIAPLWIASNTSISRE